jgi:hypothetical protein
VYALAVMRSVEFPLTALAYYLNEGSSQVLQVKIRTIADLTQVSACVKPAIVQHEPKENLSTDVDVIFNFP